MREAGIESYLTMKVEKLGGRCFKFTSPSNKGVPDRIVLLPGGKVIFVELKTITGVVSEIQQYRMEEFKKLGFNVLVFRTTEEISKWILSLSSTNKI